MLLFAALFAATLTAVILVGPATLQASKVLYPVFLLICVYLYYVWHWVRGGQTLGMKAWGIAVTTESAGPLNWITASARFMLALISISLFGFGWIWALFDSDKLTFYDRCTGTMLVRTAAR
jgi:uncharacterized RDD family membrane protein YckC